VVRLRSFSAGQTAARLNASILLPDGFEDQWIDAVLRDRDAVKNFSQRVEKERPPMELRYMKDVADDRGLDWEYTERVLSSRDLDDWMRQGW
jgi:hypothetical protein